MLTGKRDTTQAQLSIAVPGLRRDHPDAWNLAVLNAVLGDGMSSRLFLGVREELGLAYDVSSGVVEYADAGAVEISAGVDPAQLPAAIEAILAELARLVDEAVGEEELAKSKAYLAGGLELRMDDTRHLASWIGGQEALHDRVYTLDDALAAVEAVRSEDIQRLARHPVPGRRAADGGGGAGAPPPGSRSPPGARAMTARRRRQPARPGPSPRPTRRPEPGRDRARDRRDRAATASPPSPRADARARDRGADTEPAAEHRAATRAASRTPSPPRDRAATADTEPADRAGHRARDGRPEPRRPSRPSPRADTEPAADTEPDDDETRPPGDLAPPRATAPAHGAARAGTR